MRIVVVTGMSGSGKTGALRALEDLGFYGPLKEAGAVDVDGFTVLERADDFSTATTELWLPVER